MASRVFTQDGPRTTNGQRGISHYDTLPGSRVIFGSSSVSFSIAQAETAYPFSPFSFELLTSGTLQAALPHSLSVNDQTSENYDHL